MGSEFPEPSQRRYFSAASSPVVGAAEAPASATHAAKDEAAQQSPALRPLAMLRTASPERSQSFSAPTSPFLPRFGAQQTMAARARTYAAGFGGHESALPLLAAPLSQQASPTHQRAQSIHGPPSMHGPSSIHRPPSIHGPSSIQGPQRRSSIAVAPGFSSRMFASDRGRAFSIDRSRAFSIDHSQRSVGSDDDDDSSEKPDSSSCDGDIDGDSMALDDTEAGSGGRRRQSGSSAPRNKAVERLLSLAEAREPLAAEMAHEGHITRTIRHSSVQEWLRASSSSAMASPPLDDAPRVAARPRKLRARDADPVPFPSPSSSAVSSPRLLAAPSSCPPSAAIVPPVRLGKRKALDDADAPAAPRPHAPKRQAMSPSGLRAQLAFAGPGARRLQAHMSPRSGPSSPLLPPRPALPASAGTCPPLAANRTRSRSGASLAAAPNIGHTNGVFSRMNIHDADDEPQD
ncbi:hypothetical protein H4S02_008798 [Coemansia sp. RSA 2611]|nr:hypothetical protein H4S02_008798 [Coemansia sp. RSA 2611]